MVAAPRRRTRVLAAVAATVLGVPAGAPAAAVAGAAEWSPPAVLSRCSGGSGPRVVFPSVSPTEGTGPGAIVWPSAPACPGGAGTRIAPLGAGDAPGRTGYVAITAAVAAAGPHGRIVVAGYSPEQHADSLAEGVATAQLTPAPQPDAGAAPLAATTAYLGDVALAAALPGPYGGLRFRVERWFAHAFGPWHKILGGGAPTDTTLALDYRSDLLALWVAGGTIVARDEPASGAPEPLQRLAHVAGVVHMAALRSDDNRAIVAWSEQHRGITSVYLDQSGAGVRFGAPQLVERYVNPYGLNAPAASPLLVRLRSESVMLAWQGAASGRWVVRAAPVDQLGLQKVTTLSSPSGNALLAALAPAPDGGALALWTEPEAGAGGVPDLHETAIAAARGIDTFPGLASFGPREQVAPPGPNGTPTVAVDPDSDRAVAVWRRSGGALQYAIRSPPG